MNKFLALFCICASLAFNVAVASASCKLPLAMPGQDATWTLFSQGVFVEENYLRELTMRDLARATDEATFQHFAKSKKFELQYKIVDESNGLVIVASKNKYQPPFGFIHVFLLSDRNSPDFVVLGFNAYLYSDAKEEY